MHSAARSIVTVVLALPLVPAAQAAHASLADGDRRYLERDARGALATYEMVLVAEPTLYEALWKASRSATDLGEFEPDRSARMAYLTRARDYARRAVLAKPTDAEGHFELARAVGRMALSTKRGDGNPQPSARERIKMAEEVRSETLAAVRCDSLHAGALHILGVWNARVMRLTLFERVVGRAFLSGGILSNASWAEAQRNLERSVALEPDRIVHRLDLAGVYKDTGKKDLARAQLEWILRAPIIDFNDANYKQLAAETLRGIK